MSITIEAIYEAGVLRPLAPLPELADNSKVRVTIEPASRPLPKVRRVSGDRPLQNPRMVAAELRQISRAMGRAGWRPVNRPCVRSFESSF